MTYSDNKSDIESMPAVNIMNSGTKQIWQRSSTNSCSKKFVRLSYIRLATTLRLIYYQVSLQVIGNHRKIVQLVSVTANNLTIKISCRKVADYIQNTCCSDHKSWMVIGPLTGGLAWCGWSRNYPVIGLVMRPYNWSHTPLCSCTIVAWPILRLCDWWCS